MLELLTFLLVLIILGFLDIRAMKKANLKREIIPYLALSLIAGTVGFVYLFNPFGDSLVKLMFDIFGIKG